MPRIFNRVLTFHVEGEIYDRETKPEDIIKNYTFNFKQYSDDNGRNKSFLVLEHRDSRGSITKMTRLPKIHPWKKPDTEFFLKM